ETAGKGPEGGPTRGTPPAPVEVFLGPARGVGDVRFQYKDSCGGRILSFRFNRLGYRGPEWPARPPEKTVRILALGGSSTLGVANPEDKTWPGLLEARLQGKLGGLRAEVLNAGRNAEQLPHILEALRQTLGALRPRVAIYYGGYNEVAVGSALFADVSEVIDHLNKRVLPWLSATLYSRSMLYTVLLEKYAYLRASRASDALVPDVKSYLERIGRLAEEARRVGARLVIVLQENRTPRGEDLKRLSLEDPKGIRGYVAAAGEGGLDSMKRIASRQQHVLMEALRRLRPGSLGPGVEIVDPSPAFAAYPDRQKLFCDPIHLTDAGNAVLAGFIAEKLPPGFWLP
ncbi:MAG: SGNH/GDSL hydrolase family protein, partial [Candidatus Tectomicrobia bacterium]|nr:SGNH/GDSL hydrolase family protein [Candidatus Tectomicrobia bacterium]